MNTMNKTKLIFGVIMLACLAVFSGCSKNAILGKSTSNQSSTNNQPSTKQTESSTGNWESLFPVQVGAFKRSTDSNKYLAKSKEENEKDPYIDDLHFFYGDDRQYVLAIKKYDSAEQAKTQLDRQGSEALPRDEYLKKIKFPKCIVHHEGDGTVISDKENAEYRAFKPPYELVKRIPLKSGEALVMHPPLNWDDDCKNKVNERTDEDIYWADGVYLYQVSVTSMSAHHNVFGEGEAFLKDYLSATSQK